MQALFKINITGDRFGITKTNQLTQKELEVIKKKYPKMNFSVSVDSFTEKEEYKARKDSYPKNEDSNNARIEYVRSLTDEHREDLRNKKKKIVFHVETGYFLREVGADHENEYYNSQKQFHAPELEKQEKISLQKRKNAMIELLKNLIDNGVFEEYGTKEEMGNALYKLKIGKL